MPDPIERNTNDRSADPFSKWVQAFEGAYALTDTSINNLSSQKPGLFRKSSGESLQIRIITKAMLTDNLILANEIHGLALHGHLGFGTNTGKIEFRKDIADKIGSTRTFAILNLEHPEKVEMLNAEVGSIDEETYSLLAGVNLLLEPKPELTAKTIEKKKESEPSEKSPTFIGRAPIQNNQRFAERQKVAQERLVLNAIKHANAIEKKRNKHAREEAEKEKKIVRTEIKKDVIGHEIKNREIDHSDTNRKQINNSNEIARENKGRPKTGI
jgi:hypothetical protein